MYPVKLTFPKVLLRIKKLLKNQHYAEALVTSVFTFEKLMKRSLRRAIVAQGFTLEQADILLNRKGFDELKTMWEVFEKDHKRLPVILEQSWQYIANAKTKRNNLVHGNQVYDLSECKESTEGVLEALEELHDYIVDEYEVDPWSKRPRKKASLSWSW